MPNELLYKYYALVNETGYAILRALLGAKAPLALSTIAEITNRDHDAIAFELMGICGGLVGGTREPGSALVHSEMRVIPELAKQ